MTSNDIGQILVVDDELELKNILVEALTAHGYVAAGFTSGEEALAVLRDQPFDVLLTDLMMPGMDGITLVKEAMQIDPNLVCIMMTGQGTIQTAVDAMKVGAFDYVLKPFRLQTMLPILTRAMNTRHLRLENVQLREAVAIHELSETIAFTLDPKTVLSKLADAALLQSEADEVSVLLPTDEGDELYVAAVRGEKRERLLGERIPLGESIASWVAREREPLVLNGEVHDDRFLALWPRPEINSSVSIPMLVAQKLVGVLNLNVINKPRPFTLGQMKALTILAGTAAAALESASLYAQIENQRQRLDTIVANVPGVVWEAWGQPDESQHINFVSDQIESMLGYAVEEWLATPNFWLQIIHPDDRERTVKAAADAFAKGKSATLEFRWLTKDGRELWVESTSAVIKDEQGRAVGLRGVTTDINKRKRAEAVEARRAVHTLFRAEVSAALAGHKSPLSDTLSSCAEAMVRHLNAAFARVWTFNREENMLELQASAGIYTHLDGAHARVPLGSFKIGRIAEQRLPHISNDVPNDSEVSDKDWATREGMVAFAGYPLIVEDRLLGVMALFAREALEDDTLDALASVADIVSQGIERQRAEAALRASEAEMRAVFASMTDVIMVLDSDGRHLKIAPTNTRHLSRSAAERIGKTLHDIFPKDTADFFLAQIRTALQIGRTHRIEYSLEISGELRWLDASISPMTADSVVWVARDITERKREAAELEESESRFRQLAENINEVFWIVDPVTNESLYVSPAFENIWGRSCAELLAQPDGFLAAVHPDDWQKVLAGKERQQLGEPTQDEYRILGPDGSIRWISDRASPIKDEVGKVTRVVGIAEDITERKEAEAALRESEERYRELFESNPYPMWVFDLETLRFLAVNDAAVSHYGYSRAEFLGMTIVDIRPPEDVPRLTEHLRHETPGAGIAEWRHYKKDGTLIDVEISSQMLRFGRRNAELVMALDVTARKKAEAALRESEERYRNLVENAHDIIYTHDLKGNYTSSNKAGEAITGYTLEESLQRNLADTVAPEYVAKAREMTARKIAGEQVTAYELEIIAKDGRRIPIEVNTRLQVENGVPVGIQGIARDITDRKQAEAELRFQKSLLESQSEASMDGVLVVSPNGKVLSFNRRFLDIWDLAEPDVRGNSDYEALELVRDRVLDADEFVARVKYLYEHRDERSDEEIALKDGRTLERHSAPVHGPQGEYYGRVWFFRDITQRKSAQAELNRLATAVEQTVDSIVITDTNGNIEYVNPAFERITGYRKEEVLGQNPRLLKSGKTEASVYRELWETIQRGEVWSGQLVNRKKDGTLFNERATISAVLDDAGKIAHYIAVKQDTTHETQLEEQLRQSQKMEAIGQLAGGVAHDFNNLLTAINGYSGLALQRIEDENPVKPYIEEIKKAGDRAANLTRQLLAFGRKQILQPLPLSLNDVVSDLNKMLRRLIGEDIRLAARLDLDLKKIKADPGQIEQVLMNLVVNARDAMPRGGSLTIETANVQIDEEYASRHIGVNPGAYVMLAVSDNGTGMDEETKAKLFEPFFTTKEKGKGTGLGLSTVYGIVKQSGGNIWVYSELGHGTTFKVYLPQVDDPVGTVQAKPEDDLIRRGSETVLLVEDEDVVRGLAQRILEEAGYRVITASGGEEAVTWCANNAETIHLLLTDVVMPETSGKDLAAQLTSLRPQTKVLFMSGYTDEAIVHQGVLDSNVEFIQKPFTPTALSRKVRQVLDSNGHSN